MRNAQGFKKRYIFIPVIVLLAGAGYMFSNFSILGQNLYKKVKVNSLVTLYITQASAGATTAFSYRYFLYDAKKSDVQFMEDVGNNSPFMITSDDKAVVKVQGRQLYLQVRGDIYSFTNAGNYSVQIHLDAAPL